MSKKAKNVAIYRPNGEMSNFEIGAKLFVSDLETDSITQEIRIYPGKKVEVEFSDGRIFVFDGFPFSYEL